MIDFRNVNTLWTSVLVETCQRLGLTTAVISPGSRSTPLTVAFARHPQIATIPILDERSAAFFALGRAKKTGVPTILICTSGTAGANFYPAVVEATQSHIPLIILTADRPPELRHCRAGQTIDQIKLYGSYPNWYCELALPEASLGMLRYLRQNIIQAWERSLYPLPGVIHLNLPFREPLAPISQSQLGEIESRFDCVSFFEGISRPFPLWSSQVSLPLKTWKSYQQGIIIAGLAQPRNPELYCQAIAKLAKFLSFPVLGEALSPIRNYASLNPYLISTYDLILRNTELAEKLAPEIVIQIGELPTSKELRCWLEKVACQRWVVDIHGENYDPLHGKSIHLYTSIEQASDSIDNYLLDSETSNYCQQWCEIETKTRQSLDQTMTTMDTLYEGKAAWLLSRTLPSATPIFMANSMSVRNAEFFWQLNDRKILPYFSRGANGIDGTLSTALGVIHSNQPGVLLTGDLALLHDNNGFLIGHKFKGHLTIILINNYGGGIFEMLPIAELEEAFEEYFATPQIANFAKLCAAYDVEYQAIETWETLEKLLTKLPETGIRVLEIICDRKADAQWLKNNLSEFSKHLSLDIT
jgi:2-succinyl-5-enolpyruvyl-6-hydroxy-3-cyclohexene-1-carboxylate synthase